MHLIKFIESHRVIQFRGVALEGQVTRHPCECCGTTDECERYRFDIDSLRHRLLCPQCTDALGRALHPENYDRLHSYHLRAWRACPPESGLDAYIESLDPNYPEHGGQYHTPEAIASGDAGWGVYGRQYDDDHVQHVVDCKTKQDAEAWAAYLGKREHEARMEMLKPFIDNGRLELLRTREDGTLEYCVNMDDPRSSGMLIVHPPGAALDYDPGPPWSLEVTSYHDKEQHSVAGCEIEAMDDEHALVNWLEEYTEPSK